MPSYRVITITGLVQDLKVEFQNVKNVAVMYKSLVM